MAPDRRAPVNMGAECAIPRAYPRRYVPPGICITDLGDGLAVATWAPLAELGVGRIACTPFLWAPLPGRGFDFAGAASTFWGEGASLRSSNSSGRLSGACAGWAASYARVVSGSASRG
jgi:hypothetical protein